jgi:hypothetical protein
LAAISRIDAVSVATGFSTGLDKLLRGSVQMRSEEANFQMLALIGHVTPLG